MWDIIGIMVWFFISLIAFPVAAVVLGWIPGLILAGISKILNLNFSFNDFMDDMFDLTPGIRGYLKIYFFGVISFFIFMTIWLLIDFLIS